MSDEEELVSEEEEEEEEEEEVKPKPRPPETPRAEEVKEEPAFVKRQNAKMEELDEQLREYVEEWRKQRSKEEDELKRLKEKQVKRRAMRQEEEKKLQARKLAEEKRKQKEYEEKKKREMEEKKKRLEEAERKRQALLKAEQEKHRTNFIISRSGKSSKFDDPRAEFNKPKEVLEEEKKISLGIRIKPLSLDGLGLEQLKAKATEMWEAVVKLETEKYDLEQRQKRQDYDLKELSERQKQSLRNKAMKRGLDPEALTGKYPPKIRTASKFERQVDRRTYDDKKKLYHGGFDELAKSSIEDEWKSRFDDFDKRPKAKLLKWFGERPGKKKGDPDTPPEEDQPKQKIDEVLELDELIPPPLDDEELLEEEAEEAAEEEEEEEEGEEEEEEEEE